MVKKKIDNRIRIAIENGVKARHRTLFVIVGDKGKNQVPILYDMLSKSVVKQRPTVLWCYKNKDDAISSHGKKRIKKIQSGKVGLNEADFFDAFRVSTTIHGRYYKDSHTILGKTYGVCVLQDFEAITPNILARTIETVEGGGLIILLLKTVSSLTSLFSMKMDIHNKFKTESHKYVKCRFNERLILSLANCKRCLVVDDQLSILPISSKTANIAIESVSNESTMSLSNELKILKETLKDTPPAGQLVHLCKTYDQAKALSQFIDTLTTKTLRPPTSLTAARGRGKSAAMGLSLAAAIAFGYANIFVTSPSPDNLVTLFEFVLKGLDALEYQEHIDYTITRSINPDFNKAIIKINFTKKNRQTIQYISPTDNHLLNNADLLIIDEAAAIPLPLVKSMLGPYIVFMASTINGYEGTGRSLSLKLISQLQKENSAPEPLKLHESIRYAPLDPVESWLTSILCLDDTIPASLNSGCPVPDACELYYVDRDALFSYHKAAEAFLHKFMSICVSSHYKNSPNDLQLLCDAPAHHLFCLLGPVAKMDSLPEILVIIQVCMEGQFSNKKLEDSMSVGKKSAGDLIPWNITEQYGDKDFARLSGARVVRIATHPNYQRMGYGKRALKILKDYYKGKFTSLKDDDMTLEPENIVDKEAKGNILLCENVQPRKGIPTLLKRLTERKAEKLDYIGTCFGLTPDLLRFWKSLNFVPVYLSQKSNDLTGEHSCILICSMKKENYNIYERENWLASYFKDFKRRLLKLLGKTFSNFTTGLALSLLEHRSITLYNEPLSTAIIDQTFLPHDIQRLESYCCNQAEYRLIIDLTMDLAKLIFELNLIHEKIDTLQRAVLLGIGLQNKTIDQLSVEFNMPGNQVLAKFYDCIKKITNYLVKILESNIEKTIAKGPKSEEISLSVSLQDELKEAEEKLNKKQKKELLKLKKEELNQYLIKGNEIEWNNALVNIKSNVVSVKIGEKRIADNLDKGFNKKTFKRMKH